MKNINKNRWAEYNDQKLNKGQYMAYVAFDDDNGTQGWGEYIPFTVDENGKMNIINPNEDCHYLYWRIIATIKLATKPLHYSIIEEMQIEKYPHEIEPWEKSEEELLREYYAIYG